MEFSTVLFRSFEYIGQLVDWAGPGLPVVDLNENDERGRITRVILLAVKAKVLTEAASPLFNGNADYANFKDKEGQVLFNVAYDAGKWKKAADACREAIELAHTVNEKLYEFNRSVLSMTISDTTAVKINIRNAVTDRWNSEIIRS